MKEDKISQLGDYDAPFCEQQYAHGSCYISLFKFKSFDHSNNPQTASNFRHLLSCGTIEKIITDLKGKNHTLFDENNRLRDNTSSIDRQNQQLLEENNNLTKEIRKTTIDKKALNERMIEIPLKEV